MSAPRDFPEAVAATADASRSYWRYAAWLALTGLACGVLLGGLSAWFLGSVAIAGLTAAAFTFNFHIPGALVRLFAIGRTAARYGERLVGHNAALTDQVARRVALFRAMAHAPATRAAGWQFGDQARLADYLDDVEDLDYARLRVDLPAMVQGLGIAAGLFATLFVAPLASVPLVLLLVVLALVGRSVRRAASSAWDEARAGRRAGATGLGAALASVVPLHAERAWRERCDAALARFGEADRHVLAIRRGQAAFDAVAGLLGPVAALSVIGCAWLAGARGEGLLVPVFLAFAWLALGEPLQNASRMLLADLRRAAARRDNAILLAAPVAQQERAVASGKVARLSAAALPRRAPGGRPLGAPVALDIRAGAPLVLTGASGAGKTSLLKQLAGWIGDDVLLADGEPMDTATRRSLAMLCPHDAAILADTVRANLFAPGRSDEQLHAALAAVEMAERVAEAGGLDGWVGQETLSLGEAQRLNLARAFLSDKPLILLDEPTEHLDAAQGERILARLLAKLGDRLVVLSSHRVQAAAAAGQVLRL